MPGGRALAESSDFQSLDRSNHVWQGVGAISEALKGSSRKRFSLRLSSLSARMRSEPEGMCRKTLWPNQSFSSACKPGGKLQKLYAGRLGMWETPRSDCLSREGSQTARGKLI